MTETTTLASRRSLIEAGDMSLQSVRDFFAAHAPEVEIIVTPESSATVAEAAAAHGVDPSRIAKSICLECAGRTLLIVMSGTARLDNRKFKAAFQAKPRMLAPDVVVSITGHPVGGVCPFGLATAIPVFCDVSLKDLGDVFPAAGDINAAVRMSPEKLVSLTSATWIDVGLQAVPVSLDGGVQP